jgi:photosystem II stability/assembly factor-like uncharacterized protein
MSVSKSTNSGSSWTRWELGATSGRAYTIVRDPDDPNTVYVGGYQASSQPAIYKTTNGGTSWNPLPLTGLSGYVYDIVIDPASDASTLYAATGSGVYKSTNGGDNWSQVSSGFSNARVLLMDPTDPQTIYVATYSQGVYMTANGGSTWTPMNTGLGSYRVTCFGINPDNWLFAGSYGGAMWRWNLNTGVEEYSVSVTGPVATYAAPNPAYGGSTIHYQVTGASQVELAVYDMNGRLVTTLVSAPMTEGAYEAYWDATGADGAQVPPGVYFFRVSTGTETSTGKLVLVR